MYCFERKQLVFKGNNSRMIFIVGRETFVEFKVNVLKSDTYMEQSDLGPYCC